MAVNGRHYLSMTWPDDPAIAVDWIYDDVYEKGLAGPSKHPDIDWFELYTTDNKFLDQETVAAKSALWDEQTKKVRLKGQPIRFSNRIHPLFTDRVLTWCFDCGKEIVPLEGKCLCGSERIEQYLHVQNFEIQNWPAIFVLDPHPRKPHMYLWGQVDPNDDIWVLQEGSLEGDCVDVAKDVFDTERAMGLDVRMRLMDPNMGLSPASHQRGITWQDEFDKAGLYCDLADDSAVGRSRINQYLKPDKDTLFPRLIVHERCIKTIFQMKRHVWDDYKRNLEKDLKQKPKPKHDDYPACLKYLFNAEPTFSYLKHGAPVLRTRHA